MAAMARIAVVEDDEALRKELVLLLERSTHEAIVITDFHNVTGLVLASSPDLVSLDLSLPGVDGTVICREIRAHSAMPIIVVTARSGELDEVLSMSLGADDFVAKPYSANVLLTRIDALLRRSAPSPSAAILEHRGLRLDTTRHTATAVATGQAVELTKNEARILAFLMAHAGIIVERATLAAELWDSHVFIDDNTLTVNMGRLRRSLERIGFGDYLITHRGQGYSV